MGFITTPFGKILNYFTQTTKYIEKFNMNEFLDFLNLRTFDKNQRNRQVNRKALPQVSPSHDTEIFNLVYSGLCLFKCKPSYIANYKILALDKQILSTLIDVFSKATHKENYIKFFGRSCAVSVFEIFNQMPLHPGGLFVILLQNNC